MGLLSSWAAFTLCHHVIINYCKRDKSPYGVIGDDMVMTSVKGAERYLHTMTSLGVEISVSKTLTPKEGTRCGEIAKRIFSHGREISPIPPSVLIESTKSLSGFLEFLEVTLSRTDKSGRSTQLD